MVFQDPLSKHKLIVRVWLPAMGSQVSPWLAWVLCPFVTPPALGKEDLSSPVERRKAQSLEGNGHCLQ